MERVIARQIVIATGDHVQTRIRKQLKQFLAHRDGTDWVCISPKQKDWLCNFAQFPRQIGFERYKPLGKRWIRTTDQ